MIWGMTLFVVSISLSSSPLFLLFSIISLSLLMSTFFFSFSAFFLFFIWGIVYIGGMMIVFTYVVFFSNYKNLTTQQNKNWQQNLLQGSLFWFAAMLILFKKKNFYLEQASLFLKNWQPSFWKEGVFAGGSQWQKNEMASFFFLLSEMNIFFLFFLFLLIGGVLMIVLPMLKTTATSFSQPLQQ
uniref:NADH dehydrogenase subunit 6 n=1 Tax=Isodiametra pulchra TaxID=504439 RepID=A0A1X9WDB0_ISOPU|nr:NADH dehydrogenase subunit 6 [Isodiametra pulchra]ARS00905.1 NADH dehydrogenase subunit 6 [Isodiametra pulchra]